MLQPGLAARGGMVVRTRYVSQLTVFAAAVLLLVSGGDHGLAQDIEARCILRTMLGGPSYLVAFSPDGKTLAFGGRGGRVQLWNLARGKEERTLIPAGDEVEAWDIAFSPDGKTLAAGMSKGGMIKFFDVATGKVRDVLTLDKRRGVTFVVFAPDGKTLAAVSQSQWDVHLWDLATRKVRVTLPPGYAPIWSLAFTPDSKVVATNATTDIFLWRVDSGKACGRLKPRRDEGSDWWMAFTPDGKGLVGADHSQGSVNLWNLATGKATTVFSLKPGLFEGMALSPDGRTVAVLNDHTIHLIDLLTHKERATPRSRKRREHWPKLAFSPDGRTLAAGRGDGRITLFDLVGVKGVKPPDATALARLWSHVGSGDAVNAYRAIRTLSAFPRQAVPFLRQQFRPPSLPTAAQLRRLDRLVPELDSGDFPTRQRAKEELRKAGKWAEAALRRALAGRPTLEVRKRVQELLEGIATAKATRLLQRLRALEVLEHMDDAGARALLADLAKSAPEARVREDAKASLDRVRKRPPPTLIKPLPAEAPPRPKRPPKPARR
jgi:tricorn protease-like protein